MAGEKELYQVSEEEKKELCKKLNISCESLERFLSKKIEKLPLGLHYLLMKKRGEVDYKKLLDRSIWGLTRNLTYDEDRWGARRKHSRLLGLFSHLENRELQRELEKALKSTLLMNGEEKCYFVEASKQMSFWQLIGFLDRVKNEMNCLDREFLYRKATPLMDAKELEKRVEKNKKEWKKVEAYAKKRNLLSEKDKDSILYPVTLQEKLQMYVKGQDEALYTISTMLYYQKKIYNALMKDKKPPFERLKPLLISGETGSGKSYMIQKACEIMELPYLHIDASAMVSTGIRGMSVDEIAKALLRKCNYDSKKAQGAVVILDEMDKLLQTTYGDSVLSQILRIIEGGEIFLEKGLQNESEEFQDINFLPTKYMLFVLAGSFQLQKDEKRSGFLQQESNYEQKYIETIEKSGLPKELLGRVGEIVVLNPLGEKELLDILLHSKDSPIKRYQKILQSAGISWNMPKEDIEKIAKEAAKLSFGARSLEKLVWRYVKDKLFHIHRQHFNENPYKNLLERIKRSL